ncbi:MULTISPECIES: hypothetical protein [Shewanella]|nr:MULTISPECIES: hypothetical protein [Shewanella]MBW0278613.1 hypothetical protein [Shewanella xiamenensis]MCU7962001.1 hypothetical protein [Shewanella sp. SW32]MCU7969933.1 hypothetical protein [Shewanella sp. SW29]MCU8001025.1 hypothetical protein [Shewanella sp. SM95]MCU8015132.1 hypothetical protein [Shewanella sp. SM74]
MANLSIKSRKTGETFNFWMPLDGGYIRLESQGRSGTLGRQICVGGGFMGNTLSARSEASFEKQCRSWYRAYMRNQSNI